MKHLLLFLSLSLFGISYGQKIDSVSAVKLSEIDKNFFSDKKKKVSIGELEFSDGNVIKSGDIIRVSKPSGVDTNVNFLGKRTMAYEFIMLGTPEASLLKGVRFADTQIEDKEFKVVKIFTNLQMGQITTYALILPQNTKLGTDKYATINNLERAYAKGEILLLNTKMTKEQAIKLLEEKKKLLDLGLATQEEFDKLREELKSVILQ